MTRRITSSPVRLRSRSLHLIVSLISYGIDGNELAQKTKGYLNKGEVQGVMARRDKIVEYFQKLISEKGESEVLY